MNNGTKEETLMQGLMRGISVLLVFCFVLMAIVVVCGILFPDLTGAATDPVEYYLTFVGFCLALVFAVILINYFSWRKKKRAIERKRKF